MADLKLQDLPDGTKVRVTIEGVVSHTYQDSPKFLTTSQGIVRGQYFIDEAVSAEVVETPVPEIPVGVLVASHRDKSLRMRVSGDVYAMVRLADGRPVGRGFAANPIQWLIDAWHRDGHYLLGV